MSSGYERPGLKLTFPDTELAGLEIRCRRLSLGRLLEINKLRFLRTNEVENEEDLDALVQRLTAPLHKAIKSWNLLDGGEPVPVTAETIADLDWSLMKAITGALLTEATTVPAPLPKPSGDGEKPSDLEASIPMEAPSSSL